MNKTHVKDTPRTYRQHGRVQATNERTANYPLRRATTLAIALAAGVGSLFALAELTEVHANCSGPTVTHTVGRRDTLYSLSQEVEGSQGLPSDEIIEEIRDLNPSIVGYTILRGQNIQLPAACEAD